MKALTITPGLLLIGSTIILLAVRGIPPGPAGIFGYSTAIAQTATMSAVQVQAPRYQPPRLGSPGGRVGGGTRGHEGGPGLAALTPDHIGLTAHAQPTLYWYLSAATSYPVELTITSPQAVQPLLETRLQLPRQPGIHRVRLADHGIHLEPGRPYQWFVALVRDANQRSKDVVAGGMVEYRELPAPLRAQLQQASAEHVAHLYAELGFWYDALAAVSHLVEATPQEPMFRRQRAALLEQVSLPEVAAYDMQQVQ